MKYYLDVTLLADAETNLGFLWQKVYQQIHIALVENKVDENSSLIAVSFPKYEDKTFPLGDKLRLFSDTKEQLEKFNIAKWLSRLTDYTHYTSIKDVPTNINQYARFKRKQFKSNLLKEAKRRSRYKEETLEVALKHFEHYQTKSTLPFINLNSLSKKGDITQNTGFKLFIKRELLDESQKGEFNCYGLSKTATVPIF